jgi:sigma54-dependent transcription regulator
VASPTSGETLTACSARAPRCGRFTTVSKPPAGLGVSCSSSARAAPARSWSRAIHRAGANRDAPFVAVNCPAIPRDLIESELFGHKCGSFSRANVDYLGLFRAAEGGTLLLDEVTEMNLETQSKLPRALQERTVRPVGSIGEVAVNVRVIASTNRRPEQAVKMGLLRDDLITACRPISSRFPRCARAPKTCRCSPATSLGFSTPKLLPPFR